VKSYFLPIGAVGLAVWLSSFSRAAIMTMDGSITDSTCYVSHAATREHNGAKSDQDCVRICVKAGAKFVFVANDMVYSISNQNMPGLTDFAGTDVRITGVFTGQSIQVSKIALKDQ